MIPLNEITTLRALWRHPEWKRLSKEFLKDKSCVWCGAKAGDTYIDRKGKERRVGLSPHHVKKHKWGLKLYRQVNNKLFSAYWDVNKENHGYALTLGLYESEIRKQVKFLWSEDNREVITSRFEQTKKEILADYINFKEGKIIPFCGRCHFAREKGLIICPVCKKNYVKPRNKTCRECKAKEEGLG